MNKAIRFFLGVILGAMVGATVAILLAPTSGDVMHRVDSGRGAPGIAGASPGAGAATGWLAHPAPAGELMRSRSPAEISL